MEEATIDLMARHAALLERVAKLERALEAIQHDIEHRQQADLRLDENVILAIAQDALSD
jgi:ABC-type uncharacterized transport system fused permease/ATPase subunit